METKWKRLSGASMGLWVIRFWFVVLLLLSICSGQANAQGTLPSGWSDSDAGSVGLSGSASYTNNVFTVSGAGTQIYSTADSFHFADQSLSGNGSIVARVVSVQGTSGTGAVGVMIRETLNANSTNANTTDWIRNGALYFYYRGTTGGNSVSLGAVTAAPPYWLQISRNGNSFSSFVSSDGINWQQIGSAQTVSMAQNVQIGLAVTSGSTSSIATATFDNVSVTSTASPAASITNLTATTGSIGSQVTILGNGFGASQGNSVVLLHGAPVTVNSWSATSIGITIPTGAVSGPLVVSVAPNMNDSNPVVFSVTSNPLPSGWLDQDVGIAGVPGSGTYSNGVFTIIGAGQQIYGTADAFHFVYQPVYGDGTIVARIASSQGGSNYAVVGVMIRETLTSGAVNATTAYWPNLGAVYFDLRGTTGSTTSQAGGVSATLPLWVKAARSGTSFSVYYSSNNTTWTQLSTNRTINMAQSADIGLVVTSGSSSAAVTATFDNYSSSFTPAGLIPTISTLNPTSGGVGNTVTISGSGFGSTTGTVTFNGTAATTTSWTPNSIQAAVPSGATTGNVVVTASGVASNGVNFSVYNPVISSLTPPTAGAGALVALAGSGFGQTQGTSLVYINGISATVTSWSDTNIQVTVPPNATSGLVTVSEGGVTSNSLPFNFENLSITGISPNMGPVGSAVVISGTGFGTSQSTSTVGFWGNVPTVQSWNDTQITVTVPTGASTGGVTVVVGSIVSTGPVFTVTQAIQLTDSKGNVSSYTSALIGGKWRSAVGQGSGCSSCTQRGNISYTYDFYGNVLSRTDENGHTTSYTYDSNGNVTTVTVPVTSTTNATTTYTYNNFGEVLTSTDPLGNVTTNNYDGAGNLLSVTTPAPGNGASASVTKFAYNGPGELTQITDPLGNQTNIAYFPTGMIQTITDAQSHVTTYAYDSQGNRTSVTDANSKQTTFTYDSMNRLTKITYPDTTTTQFGYDIRGRRTSVTDQNSKQTTYAYDDADRLLTVTDAATNVTTYGYDTESNLTSIKDANLNTTTFDYDAFGRVTETHFPSGQVEQYAYDNIGNLTTKTDRKNQQITYTYDQLNRLSVKSYPDTTTVNYTYDNDSRLTQVSDPTGTYQFTFDNMGRLTGTATSYAFLTGRNFTTGYGYDAASNRTSFTDPESGSTAYVYDTLNRLQTLTPPAAISSGSFGFGYDALSRRASLTRPNTVNTSYSYDNLSRLLSVTHAKSGVTIDGATYTVDNAGNRNSKADLYAGVTTNYGYDNIYQLLNATQGANTTESYTFDPVGNRLSNLSGSGWSNNTSNELTSRPGVTYTYDNNGNTLTSVTGSNTTTYAWDFENRLTSVTLPGTGGTVTFKYDPFGRRIYKSSSSGTSIFAYDGINLIEETNSSGAVVARYTQGENLDEPLVMLRSSTTSYFQTDGLNSVTSLSNAAGSIANTYTYDSFGNLTASTGSLTNSFRYTGREFDAETSLYYMRARYFDPSTGRFLNEDPIGFAGGSDFYSYVDGDPTSLVDLLGLQGTGTATAPAPVTTPTQPVRPTPPVPSDPVITPKPPTSSVGRILGNLLDDALGVAGDIAGAGAIILFSPVNAGDPALDYRPGPGSGPPCKNKQGCKPCVPPVGTRAYREDTNPSSPAHRGVPTPHWHLYEMNQNPNNCQCFWKPIPDGQGGFGASPPPAGAVPIGPAGGGGPL